MSLPLEVSCGHVTSFGQWKMIQDVICQFRVEHLSPHSQLPRPFFSPLQQLSMHVLIRSVMD